MKEMISAKEVAKKVNVILEDHRDDTFSPLDTNWVALVEWLGNYILEQDKKISEYERVLKQRNDMMYENKKTDLDIPAIFPKNEFRITDEYINNIDE